MLNTLMGIGSMGIRNDWLVWATIVATIMYGGPAVLALIWDWGRNPVFKKSAFTPEEPVLAEPTGEKRAA